MVYSLYGSADGSVSCDIRENDEIIAIDIDLDVVAVAAGAATAEVSLGSASQFAVNDATNVLAGIRNTQTTAVGEATARKQITNISIPVTQGERLYLHQAKGGHTSAIARAFIYTRGKSRSAAQRRR